MAWFLRRRSTAISDRGRTGGAGCLVLFGLAFGSFGMLFAVVFFFWPLWNVIGASDWTEVPCTIESSQVATHAGDDGDTYSVEVRYTFQAPDPAAQGSEAPMRTWTGDRYSFATGSSSGRGAKQAAVDAHPPGSKRTCWMDPRDPTQSVLVREATGDIWFGAITLLFPLVGYGMAIGGLVAWRRQRRSANQRSAIATVTSNQATAAPDGPVLRSGLGQSPWGKLIASIVFCAFWNGIVSVFLFAVLVPSFQKDDPEWFLLVFLIPFELVGLGLLAWVGYNLLALANPRIHLRLDATAVRPGDRVRLDWETAGSTMRLDRLVIALEGREEASYTRGTDRVTDKEVFHRSVLFDSDDRLAMQQGRCELVVPADAPGGFNATNNHLRWVVTVLGDIPRWPDVSQEWELAVQPRDHGWPALDIPSPDDDREPLAIRLESGPAGTVTGTVRWNLPSRPTGLELRLFWYTSGRGTMDVGVAETIPMPVDAATGIAPFRCTLPPGPAPFAGKLIAIQWALELVAADGTTARLELPFVPQTRNA